MLIKEGIYSVGTMNPALRRFDVIMETKYGTTYNSYVLQAEKTAIVDGGHGKFIDLFLGKVRDVVDPEKVDYIIVNHTEPDHSGSVSALLDICPNAQVVSTKIAAKWLREIMNHDFNSRTVEDGEEIDLGGKTLRFMIQPFWHWPDTMFTYVPEDKILFSCDGFGAHYCDERMYDDLVDPEPYQAEFEHYYDAIMRPFADKIYDGVQRVKALELEMICPSHGPILRRDPQTNVAQYEEWSDAQRKVENKVAILYASAYGNTKRMAESIAEGVSKHADVAVIDLAEAGAGGTRDALESSKAALFGSCTINGDALEPIWAALSLYALVNRRGKIGGAFGSYGWSGEAVGMIEERLKGLRVKVVETGLRFNFVPMEENLAQCRAFGEEFAKSLSA